ncbi:hypothetical protein, partial [Actinomadura sp.]|uniref:hypothetical protein n=1 Tax=Actinomadura sp. TaxID=1989 RepID=UPI0037CAA011
DRWLELGRPCAVLSRDEDELRGKLRLKPCVSLPNHEIADDEVTVDTAEHPRAEELREVWEEIWGEERRVSKWSQLQIGGRRAERSARR